MNYLEAFKNFFKEQDKTLEKNFKRGKGIKYLMDEFYNFEEHHRKIFIIHQTKLETPKKTKSRLKF